MTKQWYVIRTKPQSESLAASALERNGFEVFAPQVKTPITHSRPTQIHMFPGYIFFGCDAEDGELPVINHMPGVIGWVRFNGVAPSVSDAEIANLESRIQHINEDGGLWTRFRAGQTVQVESGKLEGLARVIEEPTSPQSRVRVLLEFMGRLVPAQVPVQDLRPVQEAAPVMESSKPPRRTRGRGRWIRGFEPETAPIA